MIDRGIEEHGGGIVQTAGNSLLIVFDSIDGAVRCGVRLQHEIPIRGGDQHLIEQQRCKPSAPQTMSASHNWCGMLNLPNIRRPVAAFLPSSHVTAAAPGADQPITQLCAPRQSVHCLIALRQFERRSLAGVFRR